jgi:hypothetical protein
MLEACQPQNPTPPKRSRKDPDFMLAERQAAADFTEPLEVQENGDVIWVGTRHAVLVGHLVQSDMRTYLVKPEPELQQQIKRASPVKRSARVARTERRHAKPERSSPVKREPEPKQPEIQYLIGPPRPRNVEKTMDDIMEFVQEQKAKGMDYVTVDQLRQRFGQGEKGDKRIGIGFSKVKRSQIAGWGLFNGGRDLEDGGIVNTSLAKEDPSGKLKFDNFQVCEPAPPPDMQGGEAQVKTNALR